ELVRISAADYGTGTVRIAQTDTGKVLRFENVDIAGAPDVYVYLSDRSDGQPGAFIDLGRLKATNGSFNYTIPTSADLGVVRSVVLWCRAFNVTITYATLR
ncbi:MAG: DM13 domain-containing protein, partial [Chloroflexota bacterium]|nr:DM13 domain-containing protein [Chloroflexota bacterium]